MNRMALTWWKTSCWAACAVVLLDLSPAVAQSCTELGGRPLCGTQRSHTTAGKVAIFPHGPPARRVGNFLVLQEDGKPRLVGGLPPARGTAPPKGARPAGSLIRLNQGRDFGAFVFPRGAAGKLSGRP